MNSASINGKFTQAWSITTGPCFCSTK